MTTPAHLDGASFAALLADPKAHRALLEHVAAGCDACDDFLAAHADAFDGPVDALLLSLAPRAAAPVDDLAWARLRRRLKAPRPAWQWAAVAAVAAGLLAVVAVGPWRSTPQDEPGLKGLASAPKLELQAAVRAETGRFERLSDAAQVSPRAVLVFRAQSSVDGVGRVFLQRGAGPPQELGVVRVRAGLHELERDDGLLGVDLSGEAGPVTVWVVVGEAPMNATQALAALQSSGTPELAVARVRVLVEP